VDASDPAAKKIRPGCKEESNRGAALGRLTAEAMQ
jgi:hypothetical protein